MVINRTVKGRTSWFFFFLFLFFPFLVSIDVHNFMVLKLISVEYFKYLKYVDMPTPTAKDVLETVKSNLFFYSRYSEIVSIPFKHGLSYKCIISSLNCSIRSWPVLAIRHLLASSSIVGGTMHQCLGGEGIRGQHVGSVQSLSQ